MTTTVVVPTYNRPARLSRLLQYFTRQGLTLRVLIADSSSDENARLNRELVERRAGDLKLVYRQFPGDISLFDKLARAAEGDEAEHAVVCADDDFMVPQTIVKCAQFLEANPDYSAAHGQSVVIVNARHQSRFFNALRTVAYPQTERIEDDALVRYERYFSDYATVFCSVQKRAHLERNMRQAFERTKDYRFGEILPAAITVISGKVARLDSLYMVRIDSGVRLTNRATDGVMRVWSSLAELPDFEERCATFVDLVAASLAAHSTAELARCREVARRGLDAFLAARTTARPSRWSTVQRAARVPARLTRLGRDLYRQRALLPQLARHPIDGVRLMRVEGAHDMSMAWLHSQACPYNSDFMPIYRELVDSHIGDAVG